MNVHAALAAGKYRLTVEDYALLDRAGAFGGAATELIDGDVVVTSPEWRPHFRIKSELLYLLRRAVDDSGLDYFVGSEGSIFLSANDMPQPDILLTDAPFGDGAIPGDSVPLLVEVSVATLDDDLGAKADRYARAGVPEYWVVDVNGRVIHQMWAPGPKGYASRALVGFGERIVSATLPGLAVETSGL